MQLGMIRDHSAQLDNELQHNHSVSAQVDALAREQSITQHDLDEHYNVTLSRVDIYWEHLQAIKRVNGLDLLYSGLSEKLAALFQLASFEESRALARSSYTLSAFFGAFALASFTAAVLIYAKVSVLWVVVATLLSAAIGMVMGPWVNRAFRNHSP